MIPSVGYTIRHRHKGFSEPRRTGDGTYQLDHFFFVHEGKETNWFRFAFSLEVTAEGLQGELSRFKAEHDDATFQEAVLRWTVEYIARGLREDWFRESWNRIDIGDEFDEFRRIAREKRCGYQVLEGRDLFCSAHSASGSLGALGKIGLRTFSATSEPECFNCALPDGRFLCSHLQHPQVSQILANRSVRDAKCAKNRSEIKAPSLCHAGGHDCWEYLVLPGEKDEPPTYVAPSLTRALDFLDTAWRLQFGKSQPLVGIPSAASIAALERDCANDQDFADRVIALGDVLGALLIPDSLVGGDSDGQTPGSLNRLETVLKQHIADNAHRTHALEGLRILRAANNLRTGAAHGGFRAREARTRAEASLSIRFYPHATWSDTWNQLRARLTEALSAIAAALR